jgi:hypothetical protein
MRRSGIHDRYVMIITRPIRVLLLLSILATCGEGCISLPLGASGGDVDTAAQQELSAAVPVYESSRLTPGNFIKVGLLTASGCDNSFLGGPGRDRVVAKIRQQAQSMGANGITDVSCDHAEPDTVKGCFSASACSATALKVFSPNAATN